MARALAAILLISLVGQSTASAQQCRVIDRKVFEPENKPVMLVRGQNIPDAGKVVLFGTKLRVNTDGAPNSYHPQDPNGLEKAINKITHAISVTREGVRQDAATTVRIFEQWRDASWIVPTGYEIAWQTVLAPRPIGGRDTPCIFSTGDHKGYFVSLTALKNGLSGDAAGECGASNQLDERFIPALVLAGGDTPMSGWGVTKGDLVVVRNPSNGKVQTAVVGDVGPPNNLGEGSVALNLALLGLSAQPKTYADAEQLDTGASPMTVAILPGSVAFKLARPYTKVNIQSRVNAWLQAQRYGTLDQFAALMQNCISNQ